MEKILPSVLNESFALFFNDGKTGLLYESKGFFTKVYRYNGDAQMPFLSDKTYFIFNFGESEVMLLKKIGSNIYKYPLLSGMYASIYGEMYELYGKGDVLIIQHDAALGAFSLGGPIEKSGRLRYIDGSTDSMLIPPIKKGDPCMNVLFFPKETSQTQHTHPSVRVGVVVSGKGECGTPQGTYNLEPGMIFVVIEDGIHAFHTVDNPLVVITYHPDSDFGPEDQNHPTINRTMVNGTSASEIEEIQTRE